MGHHTRSGVANLWDGGDTHQCRPGKSQKWPAPIGILTGGQVQLQRRIAFHHDLVAAIAEVPFRLDVIAHRPIEVVRDEWSAVHPGGPFIMLAGNSSGPDDAT